MNQHIKILNQIAAIRDLHPQIEHICLNGSCMNFHVVLRRIYPDAVPYFNIDHVITKIGNKYYDITGCVNPKGYMPLTSFYDKRNTKRAVNQMMKYENSLKQEDINTFRWKQIEKKANSEGLVIDNYLMSFLIKNVKI